MAILCVRSGEFMVFPAPLHDILLPEEGASGRFFSGASSVIRNDQHPHHAVAIYVQTSDHFKGHEEHADVTAEMLLSHTSSA